MICILQGCICESQLRHMSILACQITGTYNVSLFVFYSDIYQRKHQISVLLIPIEENPRVPPGFISQRPNSTWNVSVLWHYNGTRPVTSPGIVEIGQRRVCVNFKQSGIVAPTWHQWNGRLCFDMTIKTTHNTAVLSNLYPIRILWGVANRLAINKIGWLAGHAFAD